MTTTRVDVTNAKKCLERFKVNNTSGLLNEREVLEILPVSRSAWRRGVEGGIYPQPIKMGKKLKFWKRKEIELLTIEGTK